MTGFELLIMIVQLSFWLFLFFRFISFRFILRNYIAQNAISAAEKGDFSEVLNGYYFQKLKKNTNPAKNLKILEGISNDLGTTCK